ncbi:epithelial-stromal interaction protein 1-like [Plakobranchus ocellatus]|uniref:Epithelial-stromal interaction protein 1-like n=1 Tax=Plakobranchus ocellatus TaxID=259542 RepID=A0AAV3XU55_9GAST|nr:epithelial-stromal interaction protein 1-like [Plakobranchus ocellatus]
MSKTFSSNPSRVSRGRGEVRGGVPVSNLMSRGRGVSQRSQAGQIDQMSNFNSSRARGTVIARGKMDPQAPGQGNESQEQQQDGSEGRGQHAGGYTVFSPNEKRRQKVNQMASRETEAYERFKQANATKRYNYVGTVGGGEISEEQVRARQAQKVRAAKFNRQMKQEEQRQKTKKAEEDAIQAKRDEARRKAELNAQRRARVPPAGEVRRNRESFLTQFESRNPSKAAETPPQ